MLGVFGDMTQKLHSVVFKHVYLNLFVRGRAFHKFVYVNHDIRIMAAQVPGLSLRPISPEAVDAQHSGSGRIESNFGG